VTQAELYAALFSQPNLSDEEASLNKWVAVTTFNLMRLLSSKNKEDIKVAALYRSDLKEHLGKKWKSHKQTFNL